MEGENGKDICGRRVCNWGRRVYNWGRESMLMPRPSLSLTVKWKLTYVHNYTHVSNKSDIKYVNLDSLVVYEHVNYLSCDNNRHLLVLLLKHFY